MDPAPSPTPPRSWLAPVLGVALVAALAATALLGHTARAYYAELQATRLHPLGLDFLEPVAPAGPGPLVAALGDSRVADWAPVQLPPGVRVANLGLDTQTTAQVLLRWEAHVAPLQPDLVVIQAGINDLKAVALFPELHDEIVDDCVSHLEALVARARELGAAVVLTTVIPPGPIPLWRRPVWSADVHRAVATVNRRLLALSVPGLTVVDLDEVLCDDAGRLLDDHARDDLHLTPVAYRRLDQALAPVLARLLADRRPTSS